MLSRHSVHLGSIAIALLLICQGALFSVGGNFKEKGELYLEEAQHKTYGEKGERVVSCPAEVKGPPEQGIALVYANVYNQSRNQVGSDAAPGAPFLFFAHEPATTPGVDLSNIATTGEIMVLNSGFYTVRYAVFIESQTNLTTGPVFLGVGLVANQLNPTPNVAAANVTANSTVGITLGVGQTSGNLTFTNELIHFWSAGDTIQLYNLGAGIKFLPVAVGPATGAYLTIQQVSGPL